MITFLILLCSLILSAYLFATRHFNHWKDRGIDFIKPVPFFGNLDDIFFLKFSIGEYLQNIYMAHKDKPYIGIFLADQPCLVINDFNLVNRILKQDFNYFSNRILTISHKTDPMAARSLFSIHGKEWKNTRALLSPIFAAKKQKFVFEALLGVGRKLQNIMNKDSQIEIKSLSSRYTSDGISDAVLCLDGTAISDPDNDPMKKLGDRMFEESANQGIRSNLLFLAPEVTRALRLSLFPEWVYNLMSTTVEEAVKRHEELGLHGDYIGGLLDLRKKGAWEGNNGEMIVLDDSNMVAQLFMFFTAGFETAASGVTFCLYEAACDQVIQEHLREEILDMIAGHGGVLDFEAVNDMVYLSKFIKECLRKHPAFPFVDRYCTMDYKLPGTDIVLEKGTKILVPMLGFHRDERYFEDPLKIIPERFDDPDIETEKPYFPFGMGPRTCLGMRFALLKLKIAIISALRGHRLEISSRTITKLKMSPKRFGTTPMDDIWINVHPLET